MRESGKKNLRKKKHWTYFGNIGHISGKVNEGDKIKKTFDLFKKKVNADNEKQAKKT